MILELDNGRFRLSAHGESVSGRYEYDPETRDGDMPGSGNIAFHPKEGRISPKNRSAIYLETGKNEDILPFFDSVGNGSGAYRPVYEGSGGTINIVLDADLDTIALEFSKTGC